MDKPYITSDFVEEIHDDLVASFGGAPGLREWWLVGSALGRVGWEKQFSKLSVYELAATYCDCLCTYQPFIDGNKRTAAAVMLLYLALHDIAVIVEDCELVAIMVDFANKELSKRQLVACLESITRTVKPLKSYDLQSVYQEIKAHHDALFRELAKV